MPTTSCLAVRSRCFEERINDAWLKAPEVQHATAEYETLGRDVPTRLPGYSNTHILPGYVLALLEKQTGEMFKTFGIE